MHNIMSKEVPERRLSPRRLLDYGYDNVRLYHSGFGQFDTTIHDISEDGLSVFCPDGFHQDVDTDEEKITLHIRNTDLLYLLDYLYISNGKIGLKFYN